MKKRTTLFITLFFILLAYTTDILGGKIIYPWRATTALVKSGDSFEVWLDADVEQRIHSVQLEGPYNTVICSKSVTKGIWTYDEWSGNTYNTKITVIVPADAPADRYNLKLITSTGDETSLAAVKIIKEYRDSYYIMHVSDAHRWQGAYDTPGIIHNEVSAVIDAAKIIDPVVFIDTGDFHYPNTNNPIVTENRIQEFMHGTSSVRGYNEVPAAVFMVPGNHDSNEKNYTVEKANYGDPEFLEVVADWYNQTYGLTTMSFSYGNTRFIGINNGWSPRTGGGAPGFVPNYKWQLDAAVNWLDQVGKGNLRVAFKHKPQESSPPVYRPLHEANAAPAIMLAGHVHSVTHSPYRVDGFAVDGVETRIVYTTRTARDGSAKAPFNLYKVNNVTGNWEPVGGANAANEAIINARDYNSTKLNLSFSDLSSGNSMTATIENKFNFEIEGALARFVMPKGYHYVISAGNGSIEQQFEGYDNQIVDVKMDVSANGVKSVTLSPGENDLCPDDPDKTDPGLCGCGVSEGECETSSLMVNGGTGDGDYLPLEYATIVAAKAPDGQEFDAWEIISGNPDIYDIKASSTQLKLRGTPAEITATYTDIKINLVNHAEFVSQVIPPMTPGEKVNVSLTMKNTGTTNWTSEAGYKLGDTRGEMAWGTERVYLNENETIEPRAEKTFSFEVTAPESDGYHHFQWRMMQEDQWFGKESPIEFIVFGESGGYIDQCEVLTGWGSSASLSINNADHQQGEGCIAFVGAGTEEFRKAFNPPHNFEGSEEDARLEFWYYISDPSQMDGSNQVELGSGGRADVDEYNWSLQGLTAGWNYIQLKLSDAGKVGNPDLSAINWFRFYSFKSGSVTTMIDGIKISAISTDVSIKELNSKNILNVYPNPVYDNRIHVEFSIESFANVSISVLNMDGSLVLQPYGNRLFQTGDHKVDIPLMNIRRGIYFLEVVIDGLRQSHKFLVM